MAEKVELMQAMQLSAAMFMPEVEEDRVGKEGLRRVGVGGDVNPDAE